MRRLPAPVLPPPPPNPPNAGPTLNDSPKLGDARLPTGGPRFTWFRRFWKLIETLRVYLFSLAGPPPPPCGPGPVPATRAAPPPPAAAAAGAPPGPPAGRAPPPCWPAAAALLLLMLPKANARLTRRFTTKAPGALPKLRGMIVSPGKGVRLKFPKLVHLIFRAEQSAFGPAKLGRSLNCRSRFRSWPVVMLNGGPVFATTKGFSTSFHHGRLTVPKTVKRCRISNELRPNSPERSYEFTGNSAPPWPSVSFVVLLSE